MAKMNASVIECALVFPGGKKVIRGKKQNDLTSAYIHPHDLLKRQWYLKSGNAEQLIAGADVGAIEAWDITRGDRNIVVAIVDTGFDLDFPGLNLPGKMVHPKNYVGKKLNSLPQEKNSDNHGTFCAAIALAENNGQGIEGIAPRCSFMPVRISIESSDDLLIDIFEETASKADVISCSWGPVPVYAPLSSRLYDCIEKLAKTGGPRGKGCVICFSANNYNAPVNDPYNRNFFWLDDRTDHFRTTVGPILNGYAAHPAVIAVAASTSLNKKALYSNWGREISVCAPGDNYHPFSRNFSVDGRNYIWTNESETEKTGQHSLRGDTYFGGTSGSTALVAGIAALVLSANRELTAAQVKKILQDTADKIVDIDPDMISGKCKGTYSKGHSEWFGYGKVNAARAVRKAKKTLAENTLEKPVRSKMNEKKSFIL